MAKKSGFVSAMDGLPWILKLLFCIPALNIIWAIYRIVKGVKTGNAILIIIGILWIVPGSVFCWIIDLICTICFGQPKLFA